MEKHRPKDMKTNERPPATNKLVAEEFNGKRTQASAEVSALFG